MTIEHRDPVTVVGIDTGGTFTDFVALAPDRFVTHKELSTPADPLRAIQRGLAALSLSPPFVVIHGTTIVTNAILERRGARTAFLTTRGLADLLFIGRQNRPSLYDLRARPEEPIVSSQHTVEVDERVDANGMVVQDLTDQELERVIQRLQDLDVEAVAVCFLFSFLKPDHERRIGEAIRKALPRVFVSLSSEAAPEFREYERASTTVLDAFTGPLTADYIHRAAAVLPGFKLIQSSGGYTTPEQAARHPITLVLSGPAGGVAGAVQIGRSIDPHLLAFDMGGTSTDVALCSGSIPMMTEGSIGGWPVRQPMVAVHTIGAGGGSIAWFDRGGALRVGPQSAGADPGPAAYGRGTQPTVTDALVILGRLPEIGLLGGKMSLDHYRAASALAALGAVGGLSVEAAAIGILRVVNAAMARALRHVSVEQGYDARNCSLLAFGGMGPLHACDLADALDIPRVIIPRTPGVLSALGMALADQLHDYRRTIARQVGRLSQAEWEAFFTPLDDQARQELGGDAMLTRTADLRYRGQSYELTVPADGDLSTTVARFHELHLHRYGYAHRGKGVELITLGVRARLPAPYRLPRFSPAPGLPQIGVQPVWFADGWQDVPVLQRTRLAPATLIGKPALIVQEDATVLVPPRWRGVVDEWGSLVLDRKERS